MELAITSALLVQVAGMLFMFATRRRTREQNARMRAALCTWVRTRDAR